MAACTNRNCAVYTVLDDSMRRHVSAHPKGTDICESNASYISYKNVGSVLDTDTPWYP